MRPEPKMALIPTPMIAKISGYFTVRPTPQHAGRFYSVLGQTYREQ
jgi:hypothetical protein